MTAIDLVPEWRVNDLILTDYPYSVDRESTVDIGEPEIEVVTVPGMLADGDVEQEVRAGNRTYILPVYVEGTSLAEVTDNENALRAELKKPNILLTHHAGDDFSASSVYEVRVARFKVERQDTHESHLIRRVTLTLTCAPFARSANLTTVAALDVPGGAPVTATITNADTTTGFTATKTTWSLSGSTTVPLTVTDQGSYVQATVTGTWPGVALTYTPAAPVSMASTRYLTIEMSGDKPGTFSVAPPAGFMSAVTPVLTKAMSGGTTLYVFDLVNVGTLNKIGMNLDKIGENGTTTFQVHDISRTDTLPQDSPRQQTRLIEVGGTERTPASLHAYTSSGYLGQTIVHTTPYLNPGYHPSQRRKRLSGNTTTTNVSDRRITGTWEPLQPSSVISRTPSSELPRGDYILMAAVKSSLTGERAISWAVKSLLVSTVVGNVTGTQYWNFPVADRLEYVPLGVISAPVVRDEGVLDVEIHLSNPSPGTVTLNVEEWWLFTDGPDSSLSIVGTDEGELWLDSPDVSSSVPRVWVGNSLGEKFHPNSRLISPGDHRFTPGTMQVTTISDANDYLEVELSYYKRFHSNATE